VIVGGKNRDPATGFGGQVAGHSTPKRKGRSHVFYSQEIRLRLTKASQSLNSYLADFERNACDIIEHNARNNPKDIESAFRRRAELRTKLAHLQTGVEEGLMPDLRVSKQLRVLVRGAPQAREKGGDR
jgi:hypothetical protein